ncbi:MAG: helix-turn-helix domain-containing protein [Methylococcaceae bacterium]
MILEKVLKVTAVAEMLGCSPMTVGRMIKAGELAKIQITGKSIGVLQSDVQAFIASKRAGAAV